MRKLQHDDIRYSVDLHTSAAAVADKRLQRFSRWLERAIGRGCGGLWTLSPDGKLRCESLRDETCQTD